MAIMLDSEQYIYATHLSHLWGVQLAGVEEAVGVDAVRGDLVCPVGAAWEEPRRLLGP